MKQDDKKKAGDRPESYPKPTETDKQLENQPEFIDHEPNRFDKLSDISRNNKGQPTKEREE